MSPTLQEVSLPAESSGKTHICMCVCVYIHTHIFSDLANVIIKETLGGISQVIDTLLLSSNNLDIFYALFQCEFGQSLKFFPKTLLPKKLIKISLSLGTTGRAILSALCAAVSASSGCHIKIPQTQWLEQQKFILSRFWRLEPKISSSSDLVSAEASLIVLKMKLFCCPHTDSTLWVMCVHRQKALILVPRLIRRQVLSDQGLTLTDLFNLNYVSKGSFTLYSHIRSSGFYICIWLDIQFSP